MAVIVSDDGVATLSSLIASVAVPVYEVVVAVVPEPVVVVPVAKIS